MESLKITTFWSNIWNPEVKELFESLPDMNKKKDNDLTAQSIVLFTALVITIP